MPAKFKWIRALLLVVVAIGPGCTSITSTILQRFDNDYMAGSSNGQTGVHDHTRPFKGIPITLKIPTHLDISIQETLFFVEKPESGDLQRADLSRRHLDVLPQLQYSDKVFTVDLKRPAAGQLDYEIEFQNENPQYFKNVSYHVIDETIKDITAVLAGITATNKKPTATPQGTDTPGATPVSPKIKGATRTVAWKRFDINAPDFEAQVLAFVHHHLNGCNSCNLNEIGNKPVAGAEMLPNEPIVNDPNFASPVQTP